MTVRVKKIFFGSFVKLFAAAGCSMGAVMGAVLFVIGLLGGDVMARLGTLTITGPLAGVISLFLAPLLLALFSVFGALVAYLPFRLLLKLFRGIRLKLAVDAQESEDVFE